MSEGRPKEIVDIYKKILVNQIDDDGNLVTRTEEELKNAVWKDSLTLNPQILEYGNNKALISDFAVVDENQIITNNLLKNKKFTVKVKIKFLETIQDPIIAFTIKDLKGTEITGTNTMYEKISMTAKAGSEHVVTFEQLMNLQGGEYLLSLGCTGYESNDFVVYHRLYDVCNMTVISDKNTVGYYDMNSTVVVQ